MPEHSALTGAELHEPKGIDAAAVDTVYVADGAGSGTYTAVGSLLTDIYNVLIDDVSTADTVYVPIINAGSVTKVVSVLEGSISTADSTIDVKNSSASSMGTLTISQSGSAAGDTDVLSPVSNNSLSVNDYITVETDGASATARKLWITVFVERS